MLSCFSWNLLILNVAEIFKLLFLSLKQKIFWRNETIFSCFVVQNDCWHRLCAFDYRWQNMMTLFMFHFKRWQLLFFAFNRERNNKRNRVQSRLIIRHQTQVEENRFEGKNYFNQILRETERSLAIKINQEKLRSRFITTKTNVIAERIYSGLRNFNWNWATAFLPVLLMLRLMLISNL